MSVSNQLWKVSLMKLYGDHLMKLLKSFLNETFGRNNINISLEMRHMRDFSSQISNSLLSPAKSMVARSNQW